MTIWNKLKCGFKFFEYSYFLLGVGFIPVLNAAPLFTNDVAWRRNFGLCGRITACSDCYFMFGLRI